jgi:transcriptional regulator with GAF, ATPase, and Fis domain
MKPAGTEKILYSVERALLFKETEDQLERQGIKKISLEVEMGKGLQTLRDEADKNIILRVLRDTNFNVYRSAKILGVKRESLYYFLKKFGVKRTYDD